MSILQRFRRAFNPPPGPGGTAPATFDEAAARRLVLVQAVETADAHGRILPLAEREQIENDAWAAVGGAARASAVVDAPRYLQERARRIVAAVAPRDARIAALEHSHVWRPVIGWVLPLVAFVLGAALDRIGNPQHVNMLSPPLLLFLAWNLAVYVAVAAAPLLRRRRTDPSPWAGWLGGWFAALPGRAGDRARSGVRSSVAAQFRRLWWRTAGGVEGWRLQQILHASAAAWALGVALSIIVGGLVREYRVGWESTLLDLPQVHAFLRALFAPVVVLLPVDGFTVADLERMHFGSGAQIARAEARHWVALYVALLAVVVMLPRTLLALYARWRAHRAARGLRIDLGEPYFIDILARVGLRMFARFLAAAAGDAEEVKAPPFSVTRLISATQRDASQLAREDAVRKLLARVDAKLRTAMDEIARLHGRAGTSAGAALVAQGENAILLREAFNMPQSGMAGAAAGAAAGALAGAHIDVLSGGLTLGAATALGALIGGTGAFGAARWKNRSTPQGAAVVQLGDEALQALAADCLLRYTAFTRVLPATAAELAQAAVQEEREALAAVWAALRLDPADAAAAATLTDRMQAMALRLKSRIDAGAAPILYA